MSGHKYRLLSHWSSSRSILFNPCTEHTLAHTHSHAVPPPLPAVVLFLIGSKLGNLHCPGALLKGKGTWKDSVCSVRRNIVSPCFKTYSYIVFFACFNSGKIFLKKIAKKWPFMFFFIIWWCQEKFYTNFQISLLWFDDVKRFLAKLA